MSCYTRPKVPGACVFFTVNLVDRGADTLVRHVEVLRQAVAVTKGKRPFRIDAWVVLPDHMHCVWALPEGDADFSVRMAAIKAQFTAGLRRSGFRPTPQHHPNHLPPPRIEPQPRPYTQRVDPWVPQHPLQHQPIRHPPQHHRIQPRGVLGDGVQRAAHRHHPRPDP